MNHSVPAGWGRPLGAPLAVVLLLLGACAGVPPAAVARGTPDSFSPLVKRVLPSVVNIAVTETVTGKELLNEAPPELRDTPLGREFRRKFGDKRTETMSAGSGFIIDPTGVIVTNRHVIDHATQIKIALSDGTELPARVIGSDELTDVAVIQVTPPHPLPAVGWGDSRTVEVGDWILAAGNPFGLGGSVTAGIVSAMGRDLGAGPFDNFLQLDAPINPGNSGGPAFNMDGQLVGMTTAIVSPSGGSVGIGFAVPSEIIRPIVAELRAKGHIDRGWLGVALRDADDTQGGSFGGGSVGGGPATAGSSGGGPSGGATGSVVIADVERDSPALRAGLRAGDVIIGVNGEAIDSSRALIRAVAAASPGQSVRLRVRRQAREFDLPVTVGRRPDNLTE
jgi:serine protease Do